MSDPTMREVVSCQSYSCTIKTASGKERNMTYKNSNKLLRKGFNGLKTGNTPAAGPCLMTSYEREGVHLVVMVIKCKSSESRWDDCAKLTLWGYNRLMALVCYFEDMDA